MLDTGIQFLIKNAAIVHNQFSWIQVVWATLMTSLCLRQNRL
ncbi:hypothetical protein [Wolbachia endosymbiont (group A) of Brachyopa scutellaris]